MYTELTGTELHFGYYDEEDEFFELTHLLTQEQKDLILNKLQKIMEKVVIDRAGHALAGQFFVEISQALSS